MNYALIENGVVANVIWLYPGNASEFSNAVPMNERPAAIGDTWDGTDFYRNGEKVLTAAELAQKENQEMREALAEADAIVKELIGGVEDVQYE